MSKIILLNGPALSGKDTAIDHLISEGIDLVRRECKDHLHKLTQKLFLIHEDRYWEIYNGRSLKETPLPEFCINTTSGDKLFYSISETLSYHELLQRFCEETPQGMMKLSIREAMIYVSEVLVKPTFGKDYFGKALADSIQEGEQCIDGSCGFVDEIYPVIDKLGQDDVLLIRIHGRGSFVKDSRGYIPDGIVSNTIDVNNIHSEQEFLDEMTRLVKGFLSD